MEENLFVYGTLRQGAAHPMFQVLAAHSKPRGTGYFPGKLYDLGHYPAAIPAAEDGWQVLGEVYQLLRPETQFRELDRYEGCAPESPEPHLYIREKHLLTMKGGDRLEAWIYLFRQSLTSARQILNGDYLNPTY